MSAEYQLISAKFNTMKIGDIDEERANSTTQQYANQGFDKSTVTEVQQNVKLNIHLNYNEKNFY